MKVSDRLLLKSVVWPPYFFRFLCFRVVRGCLTSSGAVLHESLFLALKPLLKTPKAKPEGRGKGGND